MATVTVRKEKQGKILALENRDFRITISRDSSVQREQGLLTVKSGPGKGRALEMWTGFAGITGHIGDYFLTTHPGPEVEWEILEEKGGSARVRITGLRAATWDVTWEIGLESRRIELRSLILVGHKTRTDAEVNVMAFEVPEGDEVAEMTLDSGYIFPPKDWFAMPAPRITYEGNDDLLSVLHNRHRFRYAGDGHDEMRMFFESGLGLKMSWPGLNYALFVPHVEEIPQAVPPPGERAFRLPGMRYGFRSHERFALGTPSRNERRTWHKGERIEGVLTLERVEPEPVETLSVHTPDPEFGATMMRYHRSHAHSCIGHRYGFSGGWHNAGREGKQSVSFEYFMHGRAHLYSVHPAVDALFSNAIEAVYETDTRPDGMVWASPMGGRGEFYEGNASMLFFLADYVRRTGDTKHVPIGLVWMEYILRNIDPEVGLFKVPTSTGIARPGGGSYICNWWDVVACGGYDGHINVLTVPALAEFSRVLRLAGRTAEADRAGAAAEKLRRAFDKVLWIEKKKRYAGWMDTEGRLHDSFYTYINTMAVWHGIAPRNRAKAILEGIDRELKKQGYKGISLPSNLISIPPSEYNAGDWWLEEFGYPHVYDPYGVYENGGIWVWTSAYYAAAWGRYDPDHAYRHLDAILDQYRRDNLQGAGNGYFWDPETGEMLEGSRQEPYLSNTIMCSWALYTLLGIEMDILEGLRVRPHLPKALDGTQVKVRYRGRVLEFAFTGHGHRVKKLLLDGKPVSPSAPLPEKRLREGSRIEVVVGR